MVNDLVIHKVESIRRCVSRAREEYSASPEKFADDYSRQDAAILNVLRACQQAIDLANHLVGRGRMGVPASTAESFDLLRNRGVITSELAQRLRSMVAFRNVAVHQYGQLDIDVLRDVILDGLDDLVRFGAAALKSIGGPAG